MLFRSFFLSFLLVVAVYFSSFAQSGCYVAFTSTFAVNPLPNQGPSGSADIRPTYNGSLALSGSGICPRVKSFSNNRGANTCYIRSGSANNYTYTSGNIYDYQRENCPLDDHIWVIGLAAGGIGYMTLRKYSFT